jgi:hypothetical protein
MNIRNLFKELSSRSALRHLPKEVRRELSTIANLTEYNGKMVTMFSKRTKKAISGCNICTFSVRHQMSIIGRDNTPLIGMGISSFFTVINGVPWILINTDESLLEVTLIHESIHYAQWKRGDFLPVDGGIVWKDKLYSNEEISKVCTPELLPYQWRHLPWELEAYGEQFTDLQIAHIRTHGEKDVIANVEELLELHGRTVEHHSIEQVPAPE